MFARFMPKEARFFDMFLAHSELSMECSRKVTQLLSNLTSGAEYSQELVGEIETLEKKADKITYETIDLLHSSFITPLDRDQIHKLIGTMDDILDLMEDVAQSIYLYDVKVVTNEARELALIAEECCKRLHSALGMIHDLRNAPAILKTCSEIDVLETDADKLMRSAMAKLFRDEEDTRQLIKMRTIYELLEEVTDRCEDVSNIIEGIVLENA